MKRLAETRYRRKVTALSALAAAGPYESVERIVSFRPRSRLQTPQLTDEVEVGGDEASQEAEAEKCLPA